jgi:hypothetical protein
VRLITHLISLYPRPFRERVGESMRQTLADSVTDMSLMQKLSLIGDLASGALYENLRSLGKREMMAPILAASLGMMMIAPGVAMFTLLVLGIEPPMGPFKEFLPAPPDVPNKVGSLVALTVIVFLPLAGMILNYSVVRRSRLAENGQASVRVNLIVAALGVCLVAAFVAGVVIDQYPCWIGVPNCD